jgi:hypothetical protein
LLEHIVVQVRVGGHDHRPPDDAGLEDSTVPTRANISNMLQQAQFICTFSNVTMPEIIDCGRTLGG